jgi:ribosomal-protein-alanine N-acetyltransferase
VPVLVHRATGFTFDGIEQPVLDGADLYLRPWAPGDAAAVRAAFADPGIQRWHRLRLDSEREADDWVASAVGRWATGTSVSWAVTEDAGNLDNAESAVLGQVGLRTVNLFEGQAQLSYWTVPSARERGVASRAGALVTEWTFAVVGLHRLELYHSVLNQASCGVARRLGFPLEATMREQLQHDDGWHDTHLHARLTPKVTASVTVGDGGNRAAETAPGLPPEPADR